MRGRGCSCPSPGLRRPEPRAGAPTLRARRGGDLAEALPQQLHGASCAPARNVWSPRSGLPNRGAQKLNVLATLSKRLPSKRDSSKRGQEKGIGNALDPNWLPLRSPANSERLPIPYIPLLGSSSTERVCYANPTPRVRYTCHVTKGQGPARQGLSSTLPPYHPISVLAPMALAVTFVFSVYEVARG